MTGGNYLSGDMNRTKHDTLMAATTGWIEGGIIVVTDDARI